MRPRSCRQLLLQLQYLVLLAGQWLGLDTRRARFDFLGTWFLIWSAQALHSHLPTLGLCYLFFALFCRRRAK